ncbi:MAG: hypothetical protein PHE47_05825 [Oscillospiraceae bacterium]|nr:hypothetical protein [Oscillospiraceae bacterium]
MKRLKSALALVLALMMVLALGGCTLNSGTNWIAKSGDTTLPAGLYILNLSNNYSYAVSVLQQMYAEDAASVDTGDVWKNSLDGKALNDWITDETKDSIKDYFAVLNQFNELGFTFDEADEALITQEVENYWSQGKDSYEETGVSKDSIRLQVESRYRSRKIFDSIYGKGGEKEVSDAELKSYYAENYQHIQYVSISIKDLEGDDLQKRKDLANEMITRARAGEDFVSLLKETERTLSLESGTAEADLPTREDDYFDYTISASSESYYPAAMVTAAKEMATDEMRVVTTDEALILIKKLDPMADEKNFEENRESILSAAKNDEFLEAVSQWGESLEITFNNSAVKRYAAKKMLG